MFLARRSHQTLLTVSRVRSSAFRDTGSDRLIVDTYQCSAMQRVQGASADSAPTVASTADLEGSGWLLLQKGVQRFDTFDRCWTGTSPALPNVGPDIAARKRSELTRLPVAP